ncbi:hypothetical protein D9M68_968700 [compost metagenome]
MAHRALDHRGQALGRRAKELPAIVDQFFPREGIAQRALRIGRPTEHQKRGNQGRKLGKALEHGKSPVVIPRLYEDLKVSGPSLEPWRCDHLGRS